ncbi:hypothetical protein C8R43DRAFT_1125258 [Mycena crocata]|nr:hypothetical protein C8R43DRAFT_1125258 [Mycena crocata]
MSGVAQGWDIIHGRTLIEHAGFEDPRAFMRNLHAALKPGGMLILGDVGGNLFNRKEEAFTARFPPGMRGKSGDPDGCWFAGWEELWLQLAGSQFKPVQTLIEDSPLRLV